MPYRLKIHSKHQQHVDEFLGSKAVKFAMWGLLPPGQTGDVLTYLVSQVGNELLKKYFPKAAQFSGELDEFWRNKTKGIVNMDFGCFYTMAINLPMVHEVKAIPHVDGMNVAFGPCGVMPFGEPASIFFCIIAHSPYLRIVCIRRSSMVRQPWSSVDFSGAYRGLDLYAFHFNHSLQRWHPRYLSLKRPWSSLLIAFQRIYGRWSPCPAGHDHWLWMAHSNKHDAFEFNRDWEG